MTKGDDKDDARDAFEKATDKLSGFFNKMVQQTAGSVIVPQDVVAFLRAVRLGKTDDVKQLIADKKIDLNARTAGGDTALHICAKNNLQAMAALLIDAGANPRLGTTDDKAHTPLDDAVNFGNAAMAELLVRHGGYVQGNTQGGRTLLHRACEKGKTPIVSALIRAGADANEPTENGATPLLLALSHRNADVACALLAFPAVAQGLNVHFAKSDPQERTALHMAVERGLHAVAAQMIDLGANVNAQDAEGRTPLLAALAGGDARMTALLLQKGADANKAHMNAPLPLMAACADKNIANDKTRAALACILLSFGADPNAQDSKGRTPVHAALYMDAPETLSALLDARADANARDMHSGKTPLIIAVQKKSQTAVKALLEAGANSQTADASGTSALSHARALEAAAEPADRDGENLRAIIGLLAKDLNARLHWPQPQAPQPKDTARDIIETADSKNQEAAPAGKPDDKNQKDAAPPKPFNKKPQSWDF